MRRLIRCSRAARSTEAFSLVELVIALGVTAFSVIAILGLLPVGARTALQSRHETRAAYLAEQVFSDLRSSSFTNAAILYQSSGTLTPLATLNMANGSTNYLACDAEDNVLATVTAGQYAAGMPGNNANYLVQIAVQPTVLANLSSVSVEVSAPAQAAVGSRTRFEFQTMIENMQ